MQRIGLAAGLLVVVAGLGAGACQSTTTRPFGDAGGQGGTTAAGAGGAGGEQTTTSTTNTDPVDDDGDGYSEADGDCNDNNVAINPGAVEDCEDGIDNNCNGAVDASEPDGDGDGFGPCGGDCDDDDAAIHPGAAEIDGDTIDNNCDGVVDADFDADGYAVDDGDCNDGNPAVYPGAVENCFDGIDNDCNGFIDAEEQDIDNDGAGPCNGDCAEGDPNIGPNQPEIDGDGIDNNCDNLVDLDIDGDGWTTVNGDCNDTNPNINPSILEVCNDQIDNDCDNVVDNDCVTKCDLATLFASSVGCEYFAIDTDNYDSHDSYPYAVVVSNTDPTDTANVLVQILTGGIWQTQQSAAVAPGTLKEFDLPDRHINLTGLNAAGAYRVVSDVPIIAYQFQPVNGQLSYSSDASLLLPRSALDKYYLVAGWGGGQNAGRSQVQIIATEDNTNVTVTPTTNTLAGGPIPAMTAGNPTALPVLKAGDYVQIDASTNTATFNGTSIVADKPISVFSSNWCANIPGLPACCCDHVEEQIFGLQTWGKTYVASRLPVRQTGTPEVNQWHILAAENNTTLSFQANPAVTGLPAGPQVLNKGQALYLQVGGTMANPGDFLVTADKPIFLMEYMSSSYALQGVPAEQAGDPAMNQGVPAEQFLDKYVVLVPPNWNNDYLVITRPVGSTVNLDAAPLPAASFVTVTAQWEVGRFKTQDGVHKLDGSKPFGVLVVGFDAYDSYAYPGGLDQKIINPQN